MGIIRSLGDGLSDVALTGMLISLFCTGPLLPPAGPSVLLTEDTGDVGSSLIGLRMLRMKAFSEPATMSSGTSSLLAAEVGDSGRFNGGGDRARLSGGGGDKVRPIRVGERARARTRRAVGGGEVTRPNGGGEATRPSGGWIALGAGIGAGDLIFASLAPLAKGPAGRVNGGGLEAPSGGSLGTSMDAILGSASPVSSTTLISRLAGWSDGLFSVLPGRTLPPGLSAVFSSVVFIPISVTFPMAPILTPNPATTTFSPGCTPCGIAGRIIKRKRKPSGGWKTHQGRRCIFLLRLAGRALDDLGRRLGHFRRRLDESPPGETVVGAALRSRRRAFGFSGRGSCRGGHGRHGALKGPFGVRHFEDGHDGGRLVLIGSRLEGSPAIVHHLRPRTKMKKLISCGCDGRTD